MDYKGEKVCLAQSPVGSAPAAQFMDWLIGYDVEQSVNEQVMIKLIDQQLKVNRLLVDQLDLKAV